jgi:UDP-N-acetylglucosamine 4,6-dehydratase
METDISKGSYPLKSSPVGSILVTGASGSFGKAFVRRLLAENLSERICVYSRGELAQAVMREEMGDDPRCRWMIGDVRDQPRLRRAMQGCDVVVHAAALKRIDVGFYNPVEMVRTNVEGTINVIEAAQDAGVKKVVGLSTDKAVENVSPYGASKALAEALLLAANNTVSAGGCRFAVTRYGNIFASSGSVVPTWRTMIEFGARAVPVSDPEVTRFFMKIDEAVDLVLDTIATMKGGEINIPDLPAYRLGDLATAMGVNMIVKGLPSWEKRDEVMRPGEPSNLARRMSVDELRYQLELIGYKAPARAA